MKKDELCQFRGKHIGFVFQSHKLVPYLTALENILLPISASGSELFKYEERLALLIERLALGDRLHHLPSELSGGQQQRVAIARALIHYPMLLLADEPTGNLDRANADNVLDLLLGLRRELRQTLVIVTHDDRIAARADRVYHMEEGKLTLYLHSAVKGKKLDMIRANPNVFFSIDCDRMPFEGRVACQYGLVYSSIMGRGTATIVEDVEEKKKAMSVLMKTQTGKDFTFNEQLVSIVAVIRIDVEEFTAKHRPIPERLR